MNSREGDQSPEETGREVLSPNPEPARYRFQSDYWERAGYSREALPSNRLGLLAEDQHDLLPGLGCDDMSGLFIAVLSIVFGLASLGRPNLRGFGIFMGLVGFAILIIIAGGLRRRQKDFSLGRVDNFCGELTKWKQTSGEGESLYGLRHGSFEVLLSSKAHAVLPDVAHYRIYYSQIMRQVVNVEEHADNAPHEVPFRHRRVRVSETTLQR